MNIETLIAAREAARLAWEQAGKPKAGPAFEAAQVAVKAVAAAQKAQREEEAAQAALNVANAAERLENAQVARQSRAAWERSVIAAQNAYDQAAEWPRCGESWPMTVTEKTQDALLRTPAAVQFLNTL